MIRCTCADDNGTVITNIRWWYPDESRISRIAIGGSSTASTPHFTRASGDNNNRNITLVIPTFNDSYDGNYTCRRKSDGSLISPTASVILTIGGE